MIDLIINVITETMFSLDHYIIFIIQRYMKEKKSNVSFGHFRFVIMNGIFCAGDKFQKFLRPLSEI